MGAVLSHIKEEQEKTAPPPKVKSESARNGYKKVAARHDVPRKWKPGMNAGGPKESRKADACQFSRYSQLMKRYFQENSSWQY